LGCGQRAAGLDRRSEDEQEQRQGRVEAAGAAAEPVAVARGAVVGGRDRPGRRRRRRGRWRGLAEAAVVVVVLDGVPAELVRVVGGEPRGRRRADDPGGVPPVHDVRDAVAGGPPVPQVPQHRPPRLQRRPRRQEQGQARLTTPVRAAEPCVRRGRR
jgi:hypothetical protein